MKYTYAKNQWNFQMSRPSLDVIRAYINIYESDKLLLEKTYGHGWSAHVREIIQRYCNEIRSKGKRSIDQLLSEAGYEDD
jgi:hypothetical protein